MLGASESPTPFSEFQVAESSRKCWEQVSVLMVGKAEIGNAADSRLNAVFCSFGSGTSRSPLAGGVGSAKPTPAACAHQPHGGDQVCWQAQTLQSAAQERKMGPHEFCAMTLLR